MASIIGHEQSRRVWQPFLAFELKNNLFINNQHLLSWPGPAKSRIDPKEVEWYVYTI